MKIKLLGTHKKQLEDVIKVAKRQKDKPYSVEFDFDSESKICIIASTDWTIDAWFILNYSGEFIMKSRVVSAEDLSEVLAVFLSSKEIIFTFNKSSINITDEKGKTKKEIEYISEDKKKFNFKDVPETEDFDVEMDSVLLKNMSAVIKETVDITDTNLLYHIGTMSFKEKNMEVAAMCPYFAVYVNKEVPVESIAPLKFSFTGYAYQFLYSLNVTGNVKVKRIGRKILFKFKDFFVCLRATEDDLIDNQLRIKVFSDAFQSFFQLKLDTEEFFKLVGSVKGEAKFVLMKFQENELFMKNHFEDSVAKSKYTESSMEIDYTGITTRVFAGEITLNRFRTIKDLFGKEFDFCFTSGSRGTDIYGAESNGIKVIACAVNTSGSV